MPIFGDQGGISTVIVIYFRTKPIFSSKVGYFRLGVWPLYEGHGLWFLGGILGKINTTKSHTDRLFHQLTSYFFPGLNLM